MDDLAPLLVGTGMPERERSRIREVPLSKGYFFDT